MLSKGDGNFPISDATISFFLNPKIIKLLDERCNGWGSAFFETLLQEVTDDINDPPLKHLLDTSSREILQLNARMTDPNLPLPKAADLPKFRFPDSSGFIPRATKAKQAWKIFNLRRLRYIEREY